MRRGCDAPIRRGNGEIRDTTLWESSVDYWLWDGNRASDRAGVCAGRRERGRGGTTIGEIARGDQRNSEGRWCGIGDGVRCDPRAGGQARGEGNGGAIWAAECAGEQCGDAAR